MLGFNLIRNTPGVLGINRRNSEYILANNQRKYYPLVDNKLKTKEILEKNGIPTPKLFLAIKDNYDMRRLKSINALDSFVIKPSKGTQGRGILVITGREGEVWEQANGHHITFNEIRYHVSNILSGLYSLGGDVDNAFAEYFIRSHDAFNDVSYHGVPDIRVVVYRGVPVMSMLRLTTTESGGKANLHQGGVGVGVDIARGRTFGGVCHDKPVSLHPDTKAPLEGVIVPFWDEILDISLRIPALFNLGYFGVDFAIDRDLGPLILELNARPGLSVQIANQTGLIPRLEHVNANIGFIEKMSAKEKAVFIKQSFGKVTA